MKFLVDAQLPRRLCYWLQQQGYNALHTLDLEQGNKTSDSDIRYIADKQELIVVTKDDDFVQSFLLKKSPKKLLLIATGNMRNKELEAIVARALPNIITAFETANFVELNNKSLIIHE